MASEINKFASLTQLREEVELIIDNLARQKLNSREASNLRKRLVHLTVDCARLWGIDLCKDNDRAFERFVWMGDFRLVKFMCSKGYSLNMALKYLIRVWNDPNNKSTARKNKRNRMFKLLVKNGADINDALWVAKDCSTLRFLFEAGANPKLSLKNGWNLLHQAVERDDWGHPPSIKVVDLLLKTGADYSQVCTDGVPGYWWEKQVGTPINLAMRNGFELAAYLMISYKIKHGGKFGWGQTYSPIPLSSLR